MILGASVIELVEDTAEAVVPVDVQPGEAVRVGDRCGQRLQRPDVRDRLMRPVQVVEPPVLA
jgi:hypothetical protein